MCRQCSVHGPSSKERLNDVLPIVVSLGSAGVHIQVQEVRHVAVAWSATSKPYLRTNLSSAASSCILCCNEVGNVCSVPPDPWILEAKLGGGYAANCK